MTELDPAARPRVSWAFLALSLAWAVVLAWLLLSKPERLSLLKSPDFVLNFGHAIVFAILGGFVYLAIPKSRKFVMGAFVVTAIYGGLMEWLQSYVPGRIADPKDGVSNVMGLGWGMSTVAAIRGWDRSGTWLSQLQYALFWLLASIASAVAATVL